MIEMLVEAERALTHGLVDQAERLYRQVRESDPKSSIAVMGLARVALERGDDATAYLHGQAALAIDPDNPAAQHLVMRLTEVMAGRGETPPNSEDAPQDASAAPVPGGPDAGPTATPARATAPPPPATASPPRAATPRPTPSARPAPSPRPGLIGRLLGRRRRSR